MQHDLNIFNFIIQLNAQDGHFKPVPLEQINFSAIEDVDSELPVMPNRWHNFLDLQSAVEFYTPLFGLFLSDKDFWRSSNSLQLDETIAIYVARSTTSIPAFPFRRLKPVSGHCCMGLMLKTFTALSRICANNNCNRGNEISCIQFLPLIALTRINTLATVIHWRPYAPAHERSIHCELRAFDFDSSTRRSARRSIAWANSF